MNTVKYKPKPRLKHFDYIGRHRYFVTLCTDHRKKIFEENNDLVVEMINILAACGADRGFVIWAYCFMPDHLHVLAEGAKETADLKKFLKDYKQKTGYAFTKRKPGGDKLWQPGYYDHVLRESEDTDGVVRYILNNPVRKGWVAHYLEYRYSGSLALDVRNVLR